jgi:hypothetical protein
MFMYFCSINENKVDLFVYPVVIKKKTLSGGRRGRDRIIVSRVVRFTTTYAIRVYHH